jgi:hypothetical protein
MLLSEGDSGFAGSFWRTSASVIARMTPSTTSARSGTMASSHGASPARSAPAPRSTGGRFSMNARRTVASAGWETRGVHRASQPSKPFIRMGRIWPRATSVRAKRAMAVSARRSSAAT